MSMISELVNELRKYAKYWEYNVPKKPIHQIFNEAADTIETLSAKLQAENCDGKWINKDLLMESLIPILNENGDMYLAGKIIGLIDTQAEMR